MRKPGEAVAGKVERIQNIAVPEEDGGGTKGAAPCPAETGDLGGGISRAEKPAYLGVGIVGAGAGELIA